MIIKGIAEVINQKCLILHHVRLILIACMAFIGCKKEVLEKPLEEPAQYHDYHKQPLGASARDLLTEERFTSLTVEINYMSAFRPEGETIFHLKNFLNQYLHKRDNIKIMLNEIDTVAKKVVSSNDAIATEEKVRKFFTKGKNITLHILITNGVNPNPAILGMAYRNTSVVLYGSNIIKHSTSKGKLTRAELETSVLLHEMGHLLGLVNKASATNAHSDEEHHDHCKNRACLMYWATETRSLSIINRRGAIPKLDDDCIEDLRKNGAKSLTNLLPRKLLF